MRAFNAHRRNLLTSLVLVCPLFLLYQVGVLFTLPMLNGADFLTTLLLRDLGLSVPAYLGFIGGVCLALLLAMAWLKKKQQIDRTVFVPMLLESVLYALTMGSFIVFVMTQVLGISPRLAVGSTLEQASIVTRVVMSVGAGLYEETVFRLGLLAGLVVLFERVVQMRRWAAVLFAFLLSALVFSAVHHIPPYGDPFGLGVFTFRVLAGVFFGLLFWFRGFAVAVYTHAFYDIWVLLIR